MRHLSYRAVARAAVVVGMLVAMPAAAIWAQTNTTKPSAEAAISVSGSTVCDNQPPAANSSSLLIAHCVATQTDPNSGDQFTATATGRVQPGLGGQLHLSTSFTGPSPGSSMSAFGQYLQYVKINPLPGFTMNDIENIFLSSDVTFKASSTAPDFTAVDNIAELDQGNLKPDGSPDFGSVSTAFNFYPATPGDDPFATQIFQLQTSISRASLGAWQTFFFAMAAQTDNTVFQSDPDASTDNLFLSPTITLRNRDGLDITPGYTFSYDPPFATTTPEPASVILTMTGLVSLAGVARRRRAARAAAE